jgi:hypothetical protein
MGDFLSLTSFNLFFSHSIQYLSESEPDLLQLNLNFSLLSTPPPPPALALVLFILFLSVTQLTKYKTGFHREHNFFVT